MRLNILIGGKAGQGPNTVAEIFGKVLIEKGYSVFVSREYESLIRGGHNFNIVTFSDSKIMSNDSKIDVLIALDENTINVHKSKLNKEGIIFDNKENKGNMFFLGKLFKLFDIEFSYLETELKEIKNYENNLSESKLGYSSEDSKFKLDKLDTKYDEQGKEIGKLSSQISSIDGYIKGKQESNQFNKNRRK